MLIRVRGVPQLLIVSSWVIAPAVFRVQYYRSKCRSYRVDQRMQPQLNSCGNSECSDEEEAEVRGVHFFNLIACHLLSGVCVCTGCQSHL